MKIAASIVFTGCVVLSTFTSSVYGNPGSHPNDHKALHGSGSDQSKSTLAKRAMGTFTFEFTNADGNPETGTLTDPESGKCINIFEASDPELASAHSPRNRCDKKATVYTKDGCTGDSFVLKAEKGHGSDRLKLRSVMFE